MQWAADADLKRWTPLVKRCASRLAARLSANIERDDLMQAGMLGLNEALIRFDASQGVAFEVFAILRIRGAMTDLLRSDDPLTRGQRRDQKRAAAATQRLEHELGRAPREAEIAEALGVSLQELQDADAVQLVDIEDQAEIEGGECPSVALERAETEAAAAVRIAALPDPEWYVMSQTVLKGRTQPAIGADLKVSAARVCQLASQAGKAMTVADALTSPKREARVKRKASAVDFAALKPVVPPKPETRASQYAQAWERLTVGMAYEVPRRASQSIAEYGRKNGGAATVRKHPEKPGVWLVIRLG